MDGRRTDPPMERAVAIAKERMVSHFCLGTATSVEVVVQQQGTRLQQLEACLKGRHGNLAKSNIARVPAYGIPVSLVLRV